MLDVVLGHEQLVVSGVVGVAGGLQSLDLGDRRRVLCRDEHVRRVPVVGRDAGHHVADDQALQLLLVGQRVLDRQQTAP